MGELDRPQRRLALERLLDEADARGETLTLDQLAGHLEVSRKTVQRDMATLKQGGRTGKRPLSQEVVEIIHDKNLTTLQLIDRGLRRLSSELETLHREMGFDRDECPECGRKRVDLNALLLQAKFKGEDSFNNQVTTRAKLLGELIENHIITVQQRDADVETMLQRLLLINTVEMQDLVKERSFLLEDGSVNVAAVTEALMRRTLAIFREQNARRAHRLPSAVQIIDAVAEERRLLAEG